MTKTTTSLAFLTLLCAVLAGCRNSPYARIQSDSRQFQDVVVPAGFRLQDDRSRSLEESTFRTAEFVYRGDAKVDEAAAYVQRRMPNHSWKMVGEPIVDETGKHLRFQRGIYTAHYRFTRREGSTQMVVEYSTDYSRR
ncbi:MAG TPA: hypothetical protein ENK10_06170 [Acidobacteria bacterium]|nr:hypothetical protein [Acidobacteriota bacterium]